MSPTCRLGFIFPAALAVIVSAWIALSPPSADAASSGTACTNTGRLQMSATSADGMILCRSGVFRPATATNNAATTPSTLTWTTQSGIDFNMTVCSNTQTIAGLSFPVYASVPPGAAGSPYIYINGSVPAGTTYGTVVNGNTLQLCANSANTNMGQQQITVQVGTASSTWTIISGNKQPAPFSMGNASAPDVSSTVQSCSTAAITGLTLSSPITAARTGGSGVSAITNINIGGAGWQAYTAGLTIS
ncbi:MAG: hypothetical protein WCF85_22165, partial [Rhodospirillaceae bacterium]